VRYAYQVQGTSADGQNWTVIGVVHTTGLGEFMDAPALAMRDAFMKLTDGRAQYGRPGVGCRGPYEVTSLSITRQAE
jgi:hypothetical protein